MKCRPEDLPAEAVEEFAKALYWTYQAAPPATYAEWLDQSDAFRAGFRALARRAIADGAEPEGWEWVCYPVSGYRLERKSPPKPEPTEVERAQAETHRMVGRCLVDASPGNVAECLHALMVEIRAVAKAVRP